MTAPTNEQLRELLAKATQGEWRHYGYELESMTGSIAAGDAMIVPVLSPQTAVPFDRAVSAGWHNGQLIVAAVNALPRLLDEVERLRAGGVWPPDHEDGGCGTTCVCTCARCKAPDGTCICPVDKYVKRDAAEKRSSVEQAWTALRANMSVSEGSNDPPSARGVWFRGEDAVALVQAMDAAVKATP